MNRNIVETVPAKPTTDGAGVQLNRLLSYPQIKKYDPFLMLDYFSNPSTTPGPGFPWHPHRGIITISYMLEGSIEHEDSLGNKGIIQAGGVQWMKAASGIVHKEMPKPGSKGIAGLQFWLNLPAKEKMSAPAYGDLNIEAIPRVNPADGVTISVIAGQIAGIKGPLNFSTTEPEMYDIQFRANREIRINTTEAKNFFIIGIEGTVFIDDKAISNHEASLLSYGESVTFITKEEGGRVLLVGGNTLEEPIAWEGPIVMNSQEELRTAFMEYQNGTFLKEV